jgi:hypothetical protein
MQSPSIGKIRACGVDISSGTPLLVLVTGCFWHLLPSGVSVSNYKNGLLHEEE